MSGYDGGDSGRRGPRRGPRDRNAGSGRRERGGRRRDGSSEEANRANPGRVAAVHSLVAVEEG